MWQNKISPKMLSFEIWRFFHQKRNIFDKILPFIFISHIFARFCTKKKAKYIDIIFFFYFYFSHFGEISHQNNTNFSNEIFLLIFNFHILANFCTKLFTVYCLQFYVRLGPKSPLDEK